MRKLETLVELRECIENAVYSIPVTDLHTHLYSADFGSLLLTGLDELLGYHYLIAEGVRMSGLSEDEFYALPRAKQTEQIWQSLFVENSPLSEAARGVLTILSKLGADLSIRDVQYYREFLARYSVEEIVDQVFATTNLECVVMTNDPFDAVERQVWEKGGNTDARFKCSLRIDSLLNNWPKAAQQLASWGYGVTVDFSSETVAEVRRFLSDWIERIDALYLAASLPPTFALTPDLPSTVLIEECIIPVTWEKGIPFALMLGVRRQINPRLGLAGDTLGKADMGVVEELCKRYPENRFMVTMLARENQHELVVTARKFSNLLVFGCWWFLNIPSMITEMTQMRLELLGLGFVPQHSDARVLEQVIYKWEHTRKILVEVLVDKYSELVALGWTVTAEEVERDVANLLGNNFWRFLQRGEVDEA